MLAARNLPEPNENESFIEMINNLGSHLKISNKSFENNAVCTQGSLPILKFK
jgi:hypothetical protein